MLVYTMWTYKLMYVHDHHNCVEEVRSMHTVSGGGHVMSTRVWAWMQRRGRGCVDVCHTQRSLWWYHTTMTTCDPRNGWSLWNDNCRRSCCCRSHGHYQYCTTFESKRMESSSRHTYPATPMSRVRACEYFLGGPIADCGHGPTA